MFNRLICCLAMVAITFSAGEASAWHRHHRHGYGHYYVGGYSSFYGYGGWPYATYYSSYVPSFSIGFGYRPSIYYRSCWPSVSYSSYYVPAYSVPVYSFPTYSYPACYASPVIYDSMYSSTSRASSVSSLAVTAGSSRAASVYTGTSYAGTGYSSLKPVASPTATYTLRNASTTQYAVPDTSVSANGASRYVSAGTASAPSVDIAGVVTKDIPDELLQSADAILAAGGYREAAQAYAQLALRYGSSDALAMRRFIAQVAGGNYEQAAVIIDLALATGSNLQDISLPRNTLQTTLGASVELIAQRTEGLAANALLQPHDATPMDAVATWLSLSGDRERAELFSRRVEQLRGTPPAVAPAVDRLASIPTIR